MIRYVHAISWLEITHTVHVLDTLSVPTLRKYKRLCYIIHSL